MLWVALNHHSRSVLMPRQRFIHPSLWEDPELGRVSLLAFALYVGCFSNADDQGRLRGDAVFLKGQVFRYRNVSVGQVQKARDELEGACSQFCVYEVDGREYIAFRNWTRYQKPQYPKDSPLPEPPSVKIHGSLMEGSPETEEASSVGWVGLDRVGKDREGLDRDVARRESPRDSLWDALEAELGAVATRSERGKRNNALKQLREVRASPAQVAAKCAAYRQRWPGVEITDQALVKHWSHLDSPAPKRDDDKGPSVRDILQMRDEQRELGTG
jgi:hypothetical protein